MTETGGHRLAKARLYGILDLGYVGTCQLVEMARRLVAPGGVDVLQLRAKGFSAPEVATFARRILPVARDAGIPFLINDFPEVAAEIEADGVHVGQDDARIDEVRQLLGPDRIVGKSTHSLAQAREAGAEAVDYIGFGPIFATPTKPEYLPIGPEDIATVEREIPVPVFCIGGIKRENLGSVLAAGARRVVIVSGLLCAEDLPGYLRDVRDQLDAVVS
jgi:thiamine-phosphate pyrophosphorylase